MGLKGWKIKFKPSIKLNRYLETGVSFHNEMRTDLALFSDFVP